VFLVLLVQNMPEEYLPNERQSRSIFIL